MGLMTWKEAMFRDFPVFPIDEKTVAVFRSESYRHRGGVRLATGRIWTDSEYEAHRKKILSTPLP